VKRAITLAAAIVAAVAIVRAHQRPHYPPAMQAGEPYTLPDRDGDAVPPEYRLAEAELRALWGDR